MEEKNTTTVVTEEENPSVVSSEEQSNENSSSPSQEESSQAETNTATDDTTKVEGQSKEEDARFAKLRHERDVNRAKAAGDAEGYKRARIKSVGGKNPYSDNAPIETDEDYEFYELQDEVNSRGLDPKNPLDIEKVRREMVSQRAEEAERNKSEEDKAQERANSEIQDFLKDHTQAELQRYWNDTRFQEFASDLFGLVPFRTIVSKFDKAYPPTKPEIKKEAANKISSPGSASNDEQEVPRKPISEMTREEFTKYQEDVARGKIKIN